jgi:hypothetical protein
MLLLSDGQKGENSEHYKKSNALEHVGGPLGIGKLFDTDFPSFKEKNRFSGSS